MERQKIKINGFVLQIEPVDYSKTHPTQVYLLKDETAFRGRNFKAETKLSVMIMWAETEIEKFKQYDK